MIRVTLPGADGGAERTLGIAFKYSFKHEESKESIRRKRKVEEGSLTLMEFDEIHYTTCQLYRVNPQDRKDVSILSEGVARCSPLDTFNKEKGRKVALTNAVAALREAGALTKDESRLLWTAYNGRFESSELDLEKFVQEFVAAAPDLLPSHATTLTNFAHALIRALI